jgi:Polysaccharide biosynthesis enzyme WcbI
VLPDYDLVIIEPGFLRIPGADFGRARELLQLPSIEFFGFHPDLCYLYHEGRPVTGGAIEAYHSMIAFCAHQKGYDLAYTEQLFKEDFYRDCGFHEYYDEEKAGLIRNYNEYGFDLMKYFLRWSKLGAFMHTSNHPKIHCLLDIAKLIFEEKGIPIFDGNFIPQDNLISGPCFPVYPEIGSALGVPGSYLFKRSLEFRLLRLHEFLSRSFAFYDGYQRGSIKVGHKFQDSFDVVNRII